MFKRSDFTNFVTYLINIVDEMSELDKVKYLKLYMNYHYHYIILLKTNHILNKRRLQTFSLTFLKI